METLGPKEADPIKGRRSLAGRASESVRRGLIASESLEAIPDRSVMFVVATIARAACLQEPTALGDTS